MEPAKKFTELIVWQKAHLFTLAVYRLTSKFPKEELFGITTQFRRAAVSICANIAEGFTRNGVKDKRRFFNISQSSLAECQYYVVLARDLRFEQDLEMEPSLEEVSRILNAYVRSLGRNHGLS